MNEKKRLYAIAFWPDGELLDLESRINRRHGNYLKAQYMKNEAYKLMHDEVGQQQKKGVALMEKEADCLWNRSA